MSQVLDSTPEEGQTILHTGVVDDSPPPSGPRPPMRAGTAQSLQGLALLLLWVLAYLPVLSGFEHGHEQSRLYDEVRTQLALGEAPTGAPIAAGTPLGVLSIPDIGLRNEVFVEGTRNEQLTSGPGHVTGTVLPGQQGVSVLAGRSFSYGAPFGDVTELNQGARIRVTTSQGTFGYEVTGIRVKGDPVPAAPVAGSGRLTLVTALSSPGFLGGLRPSETVYVEAALVGKAVAAGPVGSRDTGTTYMTGHLDVRTLALLALSLQLLALVVIGVAWAWNRWSRRAAWIVGTPALLAALWLTTSIGSLLLPGLI